MILWVNHKLHLCITIVIVDVFTKCRQHVLYINICIAQFTWENEYYNYYINEFPIGCSGYIISYKAILYIYISVCVCIYEFYK